MPASTSTVTTEMTGLDDQLSQLLQNMTLKGSWNIVANIESEKLLPTSHTAAQNYFKHESFDGMDCGTDMRPGDDAPCMEEPAYQARSPSPLFFSTTLLTFDDLPPPKTKGKGKSPLIKVHRKRASSLRLRAPTVHPKPDILGSISYHRRRLSGGRLHSPRPVQVVPPGTPRVRHRVQRYGQGPRAQGVESGSRERC
ncbi:hypothetical protein NM688_g1468 [Phlebia brevispora]|uniref:Uncharacterized protein n=1 Tax=Phlebia brevispora TaxID=194682 RepID=A0ACC1TB26_9APHY|nr:hypothetical protein NM688_g1468 [Phlebia brevispora]